MIRHFIIIAIVPFLLASGLTAAPRALVDWKLSAPDKTTAKQTETGSIRLLDESPDGFPVATCALPNPLVSGELSWRARTVSGAPSFALLIFSPEDAKRKAWDVAVFNQGVHLRQGTATTVRAKVPVSSQFLRKDKWIGFRLVFDSGAGRAQLYIDDSAAPCAEVTGFVSAVGHIGIVAGYGAGMSHGAEFADLKIENKAVTFAPVGKFSAAAVWPPETAAPAEWVVRDRFQEFVEWWPGPSDATGVAAREVLKTAMHREALGLGNEFTDALHLVPVLANAIRWTEPYAGAQASHLYRSRPEKLASWDEPFNARLMEAVALLARFYSLEQPWNPYHRDPALGKRLRLALEYWLSLQGTEGGFPEYGGAGASELPAVSFGLDAMVYVYKSLRDEALFSGIKARWLESMGRAVEWAARPGTAPRNQGEAFANQYIGVIYAAWCLHTFTGEARWLDHYNKLADWWIASAQPAGWYREHGGREDFSYSQVTDFIVDRLAAETGDPRWRESLRRAYEMAQFITGFEMDREVALVDSVAHSRTGISVLNNRLARWEGPARSPGPDARTLKPGHRIVGRYNHAATQSAEARAFAIGALSPEEAEARAAAFFEAMPTMLQERSRQSIYNPYAPYWWDGTGDYWTLPAGSQKEAVTETAVWRETRFVKTFRYKSRKIYSLNEEGQEITGVRRPGYYISLHAGHANGRQNRGAGLLWMPGFGNVFVSVNNNERPAFGWAASGRELAAQQKSLRLDWHGVSPEAATRVSLPGLDQPAIDLQLDDEQLGIVPVAVSPEKPFYLPIVMREGDRWFLADGTDLDPFLQQAGAALAQGSRELRIRRSGDGVTHDVIIKFSTPPRLVFTGKPAPLGAGMFVRGLSVAPAAPAAPASAGNGFSIRFTRTQR
jgi:hypothetical protein